MRRIIVAIMLLALAPLLGSQPRTKPQASIKPAVGLVKFDLFLQYLGSASGGKVPPEVTLAMARKSIIDAGQLGIPYFRVAVSGYSPRDLDLWRANPEEHWRKFDQMLADLSLYKIKLIPVLAWWIRQFPKACDEGVVAFIGDPNSCSQQLFYRYVNDLVSRYRHHPTILFWEMSNEWDLEVDLDIDRRDLEAGLQLVGNNFSTDQLIEFSRNLANHLHRIDPDHLVSSGFYGARRCAEHLRKRPEWSPNGPDWGDDSLIEFVRHVLEMNQGMDIISVHPYNFCDTPDCSRRDNERFGIKGRDNSDLLYIYSAIADASGKLLYIGEFGDNDPSIAADPQGCFSQSIMGKIVELKIPFGVAWGWELYQRAPYYIEGDRQYVLEPGFTDFILDQIQITNRLLGWPIPVRENPDRTPPIVILTHPNHNATVASGQIIHAVASDHYGVQKVEFWLGEERLAILSKPPYQITLNRTGLDRYRGSWRLVAKAFDSTGNESQSMVDIWFSRGRRLTPRP